jgi:ATP-binding cassette, subfamily C, bacterial
VNKAAFVQQHSEADCAAACIAMVAKHYELNLSIDLVRQTIGNREDGTNLLELKQGAEALGFKARTAIAAPEILDLINTIVLPIIIHWEGNRWVVLYGQKDRQYIVADPRIGICYLSRQELEIAWENRVTLLLEPDQNKFKNL